MESLKNILERFEPINLAAMDEVKLMNRTDTKYVFNILRLPLFLEEIKDHYRVLEVNGCRLNRYESLYFDTEDFGMYLHHHNQRSNRYKVRFRNYVETGERFFEIKLKNNKGRTIKERQKRKEPGYSLEGRTGEFLHRNSPFLSSNLVPKLWVNYSRITLVHKTASERLTLDVNLTYKDGLLGKSFPQVVIAELKQEKKATTCFSSIMRKYHIHENAISKYCFGVIFFHESVKKNRFKPKLITFNKICYDNH